MSLPSEDLIKTTLSLHFSTNPNSAIILNPKPSYKSLVKYVLPQSIVIREDDIDHVDFSVNYAVIPSSFYMVNSTNNRLDVLINGLYTPFYLTEGNYDSDSFSQEMAAIMGTGWSFVLDTITNQFTISYSATFTIMGSSTLAPIIGLNGFDVAASAVAAGYAAAMPYSCNFLQLPRVFMRCRALANSIQVGSSPQTTFSDVLLAVPNNTGTGGKLIYENISQIKTLLDIEYLKELTISFTDDAGNLIDFRNADCFFGFSFDIYRKPPTLKKMSWKQVIKQILSEE